MHPSWDSFFSKCWYIVFLASRWILAFMGVGVICSVFLAMAALRKNSCTFVLWCIYRACLQVIMTSCLSGGTQKCPEVNIKPSGSCLVIFSRNYVPCWIPLQVLVMDPKATQHRYRYNIPPAGIPRQGCGELWLCLLTGT